MNKKIVQERLNETGVALEQTKSAYQQLLGRKQCLEELLAETEKEEKDEKETSGTVS